MTLLLKGKFYCVVGHTDEYGPVVLFEYANSFKHDFEQKVITNTNRDGIKGKLEDRLRYLKWEIVPLEYSSW